MTTEARLYYIGTAREFVRALRINRMASVGTGTLSADDKNRRRFQRRLREAQMRSIRRQILQGGGGAA